MNGQSVYRGRQPILGSLRRRGLSAVAAAAVAIGTASAALVAQPASAAVGNGMKITAGDLDFVLKQILISERHSAAFEGNTAAAPANPNPAADPFYCLSLVGPAPDQVPDALTAYGLRTVDGSCNNITDALQTTGALNNHPVPTFANHPSFGATDQPFPRLTTPVFRDAESTSLMPFPVGPNVPTSYKQKLANNVVVDSQPRLISNLIVDQTSSNPAAVAAAGHPQRSQSTAATAVPCTTDPVGGNPGIPAGCTPSHQTLFIPNITTDTGLSPPYNSLFTFFGQFFDHGVDQTVKSSGTVFVPLRADDPLIAGPDHIPGNADDLPPSLQFMALTRAQNQPGPDGVIGTSDDVQDANNTDSPWVDLSQDYASHSSHQVFLRDYALVAGKPVNTGRFLSHSDRGMPTWADVKAMAAGKLGLLLQDKDVLAVPTLLTDPYGNFVPGAHGLPQYVTHDVNEVQRISGTATGDFTLTLGAATTAPVPATATAAQVCAAINAALTAPASVTCSGGPLPGRAVNVTFSGGPLAHTDQPLLVPSDAALTVATTTQPLTGGLVEGSLATPVPVPANVDYFDTPFLTDVAHNADPSPQDTNGDGRPDTVPVPDTDTIADHDFAKQQPGTYDDELLDAHAICGDGRCNENIALTTIHGIFHAEHNRLVGPIDKTGADLSTACAAEGPDPSIWCILNQPANAALLAKFQASHVIGNADASYGLGGRLFQAARFFTEMEYQHLVFEEFARKVQPAVRPFHVYSPDINPATKAEFAHAVYRFGHSMLDETIARSTPVGAGPTFQSTQLLDGFLNPPELRASQACPSVCTQDTDADHGMAAIIMGSSDQTGNEIDEFVTETLRNNLLGLPLDLPVLNITRARSEGVPPLNQFRRDLFGQTNDGQLAPYTSWADFGQHLKHPESLVNFVAAYGTHPTITAQSTIAGKRAAARAIVDPQPGDVVPPDAQEFMFSTSYPGVTAVAGKAAVQPFVWDPAATPVPFTLGFGAKVTGSIDPTATAADIETALNGIIGAGAVTVSTPGADASGGFVVTFTAPGPQQQIVADTGTTPATLAVDTAAEVTGVTPVTAIPAQDWSNRADGTTVTGLDAVDLWTGGLAELTNQNGGMLGSTFNYVFQNQLELLQDGDRLYYLNRTPGLNFRTQLEGNSFAELIQRNVPGTSTLKADAFARADCKFELGHLVSPAPAGSAITGAGSVADDPTSGCDENALLLRKPDGTYQYRSTNSVDPSGINGQSVYNGTAGNDKVIGGVDNDTFWGGDGNDRIEGNNGDDIALGGNGDDIITDLNGADVPKGGPGNDAIDAGPGDDIPMGNDGQDFINGGANDNETFAGEGNDFVIAGAGADAVFGDGGDDWIEGGTGQDLLQGDHGAPFFDDPGEAKPGNDVFVGQPGENDYDAEGGDDVMAQNAAIDRNAGAAGFDWAFHQYDTVAAADDMMINNNLGGLPIQVIVNRDRWQETEADSGGPLNDVIKGTDGVLGTPKFISGGGFSGCDAVDAAGLARITGFDQVLPPIGDWVTDATVVSSLSAAGRCPLTGPVWGDGDVLLGGPGSDTFTGRTGDDVIDGDKMLQVAISVRANKDGTGAELGRTDLMENRATSGSFGPNTDGMTLQQAVFAGLVNPGQLVAVREIVTPTVPTSDCALGTAAQNCDTAVFSGSLNQYTITPALHMPGAYAVTDTTSTPAAPGAPGRGDGTDIVRNVDQLKFLDQTISLVPTASLSTTSVDLGAVAVGQSVSSPVTITNTSAFSVVHVGAPAVTGDPAFSATTSCAPAGLAPNASCVVNVAFKPTAAGKVNGTVTITSDIPGGLPAVSVTGTGQAATAPGPVTFPAAAPLVTGTSVSISFNPPVAVPPVTGFSAQLITAAGANVGAPLPLGPGATGVSFSNLAPGDYRVVITASNGTPPDSTATSPVFSVRTAPKAAPTGVTAAVAGVGSVTVSWTAVPETVPANGNSPITGYLVQQVDAGGLAVAAPITVTGATSTTVTGLGNNTPVFFKVAALNGTVPGVGPASPAVTVTTASVPGTPAAPTVAQGNGTLTVSWTAPADGRLGPLTYTVTTLNGAGTTVQRTDTGITGTSFTVPGLAANTVHRFRVTASNPVGAGTASPLSAAVRVITVPGAPTAPVTVSGTAGGTVTFTASWTAPTSTGGTGVAITGYTVTYFPAADPTQTRTLTVGNVTSVTISNANGAGLTNGTRYRFRVAARNGVGTGAQSVASTPTTGSLAR